MRLSEYRRIHEATQASVRRLASRIPPESFQWCPRPGSRAIGELLHHLATSDLYAVKGAVTGKWDEAIFAGEALRQPRDARAALERCQTLARQFLDRLDEKAFREKPIEASSAGGRMVGEFLVSALLHQTHHRAQLLLYLRLLGVEPPEEDLRGVGGGRPLAAPRDPG